MRFQLRLKLVQYASIAASLTLIQTLRGVQLLYRLAYQALFEEHRDQSLAVGQELLACICSIEDSQGALLTHGHENVSRLVQLIDEAHVSEDIRISGVVDGRTLLIVADLYHPAGRRTTRKAERIARAAARRARLSRVCSVAWLFGHGYHAARCLGRLFHEMVCVHHRDSHEA